MKKIIVFALSALLAFSAATLAMAETKFSDTDGHWAEKIIERWQDSGYISGYPDGSFKPDEPVTRAELSKILTSAFELSESDKPAYIDVKEDEWYYPYLEKSASYIPTYSLILPYESNAPYSENQENGNLGFLPGEKALRVHVAEALVKIKLDKDGITPDDLSDTEIYDKLSDIFKDAETVATPKGDIPEQINRMHRYMYLAYKYNIMVGFDGYFRPEGYMTRAELITAIDNMFDKGSYVAATYLGVENYGAEETNKDNKPNFRYRFKIGDEEAVLSVNNGIADSSGNFNYPIQNILKENYSYNLKIDGDKVLSAEETEQNVPQFSPVVSGTPGEKTLLNFLKTAMEPVGTTLYIYGGGWDWQDVGSSIQARTIGVSPDWVRFFNEQDESFTYKEKDGNKENADPKTSYYPYGEYNEYYYAGLDCSGYVGWVLYNTFETEDMKNGYVMGSTGTAKKLAARGFGEWTQEITEMKPGEMMSMNGHIWISLGTCADGSTLILHSTPSRSRTNQPGGGVQISAIGKSDTCEAYKLADEYMSKYYPEWYRRYPIYLCDPDVYFTFTGENAGKFTWSNDVLSDSENVWDMTPEEVLKAIFE